MFKGFIVTYIMTLHNFSVIILTLQIFLIPPFLLPIKSFYEDARESAEDCSYI